MKRTNQVRSPVRATPRRKASQVFNRALSFARGKHDYMEELVLAYDAGLDRLTARRKRLVVALVAGLVGTAAVWLLGITFPQTVSLIYSYGTNSNLPSGNSTLLTVVLMSIPFVPPFVLVFALANLLFPASPPPQVPSGVMSSFQYGEQSNKQYLILVVAGMFGGLNCILLWLGVETALGH